MSREIHTVAKWPKPERAERETRYFLVKGLDYQQTIEIQAPKLIENFTRDGRTHAVCFWPPSNGVLHYLKGAIPDGASIWDDHDNMIFQKERLFGETPRRLESLMAGMNIPGD